MAISTAVVGAGSRGLSTLFTSKISGFYRGLEYEGNVFMPNVIPDLNTLIALRNADRLSNKHLSELAQMLGVAIGPFDYRERKNRSGKYKLLSELWDKVVSLGRNVPSLPEIFLLRNRNDISEEVTTRWMRQLGYSDDAERQLLESLRFEIPGQSDLVRFAVRDVWQPDIVQRFQYDAEFPEAFNFWMKKLGFGAGAQFIQKGAPPEPDLSWAKVYWRAHWDVISPTQSYEAFQRLRPNRLHLFRGAGVDPKPFTIDDLKSILKVHDYPPPFRDTLAAIAYRVIGRIDLRRLYAGGIFGEGLGAKGFAKNAQGVFAPIGPAERELTERYQDIGFSPADSVSIARWVAEDTSRVKTSKLRARTVTAVCSAYSLGALDAEGAVGTLRNAGLTQVEAVAEVDHCDLKQRTRFMAGQVKGVKRAFMKGIFNEQQTRIELGRAGVAIRRVEEMLILWKLEQLPGTREASTGQLCDWFGSGFFDTREFLRRLRNLGWDDVDADRIWRHCTLGHLAKAAKEREKIARAQIQEQRRLARIATQQQKEAARSRETALQRVLAARTEQHLVTWFKEGLLTVADVRGTLRLKGWANADIQRFLISQLGVGKAEAEEGEGGPAEGEEDE